MHESMFVTLEGLNGAGKSTLQNSLENAFNEGRLPGFSNLIMTREIGGTAIGEHIRELFAKPQKVVAETDTELLLINAARREHLRQVIVPALNEPHTLVVCDRYIASTYAYQLGYKKGDPKKMMHLHAEYCGDTFPDLTIYLEISAREVIERTKDREYKIPLTPENVGKLKEIAEGYRQYGKLVTSRWNKKEGMLGYWHQLNARFEPEFIATRAVHLINEHAAKERKKHGGPPEPGEFAESKELPGLSP